MTKPGIDDWLRRIRPGEDSTLELKQVVFRGEGKIMEPHPDGLADEIAALANGRGGVLVLGVDDRTREVRGIPVERLATVESLLREICNDKIRPPVQAHSRHLELPDAAGQSQPVVVLEVPRSLWVHESPNGYFLRVLDAKREMTPDLLARLFQQRSQTGLIRFDEEIVPTATLDDLHRPLWQRFKPSSCVLRTAIPRVSNRHPASLNSSSRPPRRDPCVHCYWIPGQVRDENS